MRVYKVIIALLLASLLFFLLSCSKQEDVATKELSYESFNAINVKDFGNVSINYGATQSVVIKGDENYINNITNEVVNGVLLIKNNQTDYTNTKAEYIITIPSIKELSIDGYSAAVLSDFKETANLEINIAGDGEIKINEFEDIENLTINTSGNAQVEILSAMNNLQNLNITASGNLNYLGYLTQVQQSNINFSGSGSIKIWVKEILNAKITGSGTIFYKGYPTINANIDYLENATIVDQN